MGKVKEHMMEVFEYLDERQDDYEENLITDIVYKYNITFSYAKELISLWRKENG